MKYIPLLLFFLLCSCGKKEISHKEQEQIFESVLLPVLDSIRFGVLPPPINDSIKNIYENDKMLIIIKDSTEILNSEEQINFLKEYKTSSMDIDSSYNTKINKDIIKIKNLKSQKLSFTLHDDKYRFMFSSELEKKNLDDTELFFCGKLGLSNIKLDNAQTKGLFSMSYRCCDQYKCGSGWTVYIIKINNKWKVDKIISTWNT